MCTTKQRSTTQIALVFCAAISTTSALADDPKLTRAREQRLLELERDAIEAAYRREVTKLYSGWLRDPAGQPARARRGVEQARRAYLLSIDGIERRMEELQMSPP